MAVRRVPREAPGGVRERPPVLATAASRQAKHHTVYPGTRTVRGAIWDRLGGAWRLTEYVLLTGERLCFNYSYNEPLGYWQYDTGYSCMGFVRARAGLRDVPCPR